MAQDIREILNVNIDSPYWDEALEEATKMPQVPQWLTADFISKLEKDFSILGDHTQAAMLAREQVVQTPELCLLAKTLYYIICKKQGFSKLFPQFALLEAPEGAQPLGYDFVGLFPILAHVRLYDQELTNRGVEHDIIFDTFNFLRGSINGSCERVGRPSFDKAAFSIYGAYLYNYTLWIGRLRFEIHPNSNRNASIFADKAGKLCTLMCDTVLHRNGNVLGAVGYEEEEQSFDADFLETDAYYEGYAVDPATGLAGNVRTRLAKADWKPVMVPGDTLIKVHIPSMGKLLKEDCDAAYERAQQVFKKCFPEHDFRGFICNTWLLCPAMRTFLKKDSNIVLFQDKYTVFPAKNMAPDVFLYVYGLRVSSAAEVDPASLPENNSMQRGVKKLLLEGTYIHQFNGFIPF